MRWAPVLLLSLVLLSACYQQLSDEDLQRLADKMIVCNPPYMRFESGCCLDGNGNAVCDTDDMLIDIAPPAPTTAPENTSEDVAPDNTSVVYTLPEAAYPAWQSAESSSTESGVMRLSFPDKAPPARVYDRGRTPFNVTVRIENTGDQGIGPGTENPFLLVQLDGILPELFGKDLDGVTMRPLDPVAAGGRSDITFHELNYLPDLPASESFMVRGSVCFDTSTVATTNVCVHDDLLAEEDCLEDPASLESTEGPVRVTRIVQLPLEQDLSQATFTITHDGNGIFFGRDDDQRCVPSPLNRGMYNLSVDVRTREGTVARCARFGNQSAGMMTLHGGLPQTFTCTVERAASKTGVTMEPITITLRHRYWQFVEQPITVVS